MDPLRKIIHVDMDAFFASVEQRNNPELKGKPVVVGGRPDSRGVVSTCSYEAREFGIRSAMPAAEAYRRCPQAVFIERGNFDEYRKVSAEIRGIFHRVTDQVEPLSLDEAYLDVTENKIGECSATLLAKKIREDIHRETQLTASAGVSYNKSLAKIASDWKKPDGLTVVTPDMAEEFLTDLPVRKFWGVGPVTAAKMEELGIFTGGQLRNWPLWKLSQTFGKSGPWYYDICRGIDHRPVITEWKRKSLGKERTFGHDTLDVVYLKDFLSDLLDTVWQELNEKGLRGKTVTVKVKYDDFRQITRSRSLLQPIESADLLRDICFDLLSETEVGHRPVRLIGASVSSFCEDADNSEIRQLSLGFG